MSTCVRRVLALLVDALGRRGAVNSLAPHPHGLPFLAASGLDDDAKVLRPSDAVVRSPAAVAVAVNDVHAGPTPCA